MGRATDAAVVALSPVQKVVPTLPAGPRPVGDLVVAQTGGVERGVGERVLVGLVVVVGMARRIAGEGRARLDGQGVGTHVGRLESEHVVECPCPIVDRFAGRTEDQVDVEVREAGIARRGDGRLDVTRAVRTTQRGQHAGDCRLDTERETVHAGAAV